MIRNKKLNNVQLLISLLFLSIKTKLKAKHSMLDFAKKELPLPKAFLSCIQKIGLRSHN